MKKDVNALRGEFIGKHLKEKSRNIMGNIVDETKNTFIVKTKEGKKTLQKQHMIFQIEINNNFIDIPGNLILMKPEDRIKIKKWKN